MSEQLKNERGFFAMVPRIVRTGYKHLSHTCKWLYTCLADLCGSTGECFRTLRSLEVETDISIASLSAMIPQLASAGLIQATKGHKQIYHIRIISIWKQNSAFCSNSEQVSSDKGQACSNSEQTNASSVQNLNTPVQNSGDPPVAVQNVNTTVQNFDTEEDTSKQIVILQEDMKEEEKESSPSVNLPPDEVLLSWLKEFRIPRSKDPAKVQKDLAQLVPHVHNKDELKSLYTYAKEHIYGENKTVFLGNLAGSVQDWVQSLDTASKSLANAHDATMNRAQAEALAMSLLPTFPAELLGIDQTYPDDDQVWSLCLQYAPDEWLYFGSPEHYTNPSQWERERINQAIDYAQSQADMQRAV